jgi:heptosyltransferase-1
VEQLPPLLFEGLKKTERGAPVPYVVCFHSTARAAKRWPNAHWVALGNELARQDYQVILPWGTADEMKISALIASQIPGAIVPRAFSMVEAYSLVGHAALTIGVDTGLTHLAAVLDRPTVEIYCDSPRWKTEGYWSDRIANVGDIQSPPTVKEVLDASLRLLA